MEHQNEYWLVSAPGIPNKDDAFGRHNADTSDCASNCRFNVPDLKVGTLDTLMQLSEDLGKHDTFAEGVVRKLAQLLAELLEDHKEKLEENLTANGLEPSAYLRAFQWDAAKYSLKNSISDLTDLLVKHLSQIENGIKVKLTAYNQLKSSIQAIDRKTTGNLLIRSLTELVNKDHFVQDSEYLVTLLVVVPKYLYKEWLASYERLSKMVVPRSSALICEDAEYGLFNVTLFARVVDEFKVHAREKKFIVRDFKFVEEDLSTGKKEKADMETELKRQWSALVRWGKTNFSEAFTSWIHIKALRLFVESVLRYGLPVNFQGILVKAKPKQEKKLLDSLFRIYGHLDKNSIKGGELLNVEISGVSGLNQEYYPWVMVKLNLHLTEK